MRHHSRWCSHQKGVTVVVAAAALLSIDVSVASDRTVRVCTLCIFDSLVVLSFCVLPLVKEERYRWVKRILWRKQFLGLG